MAEIDNLPTGEELERIAQLSQQETFPLWYDPATRKYFTDNAPETARWIFDVEQPETPDFIAEVTRVVLCCVINQD